MATQTPWGAAQNSTKYAPGIISYSTASHGGFHLSETRQKEMPEILKNPDGWYEEDCEWCKVVIAFSQYFKPKEILHAYDILKNFFYETYRDFTGLILRPGESYEKDRMLFEEKHKDDWVVISALINKDDSNLVDVTATLGGKRGFNIKERYFLVSAIDYEKRSDFGFVITNQEEVFKND
jgi:hypothetical protein